MTEREHLIDRHNGPTAQNARKTHCPQGHPLSGDNLMIVKFGRRCRICRKEQGERYRAKKRGLPWPASPFGRRT